MNAPQVLELPLDDALLKVLSSESRREILRLLAERRMTGAELATRLDLGKPAVSEHLKKLLEGELITRIDDPERRWVYYELSPRGRSILEPQRVRFYLVLAVGTLALLLGMALALGIMVFLQHAQGDSGVSGIQTGPGGSGLAEQPAGGGGLVPTGAVVATTTTDSATSSNPDTVSAAAPPRKATVVTGVIHPCPLGQTCTSTTATATDGATSTAPTDPADAIFVLLTSSGDVAPPPSAAEVYVYHPDDVDLVNHTITVAAVPVDNGTVALDLGLGANATVSDIAMAADVETLTGGGLLVPIAQEVVVPEGGTAAASDAGAGIGGAPTTTAPTETAAPAPATETAAPPATGETSTAPATETAGAASTSPEAAAPAESSTTPPEEAATQTATPTSQPDGAAATGSTQTSAPTQAGTSSAPVQAAATSGSSTGAAASSQVGKASVADGLPSGASVSEQGPRAVQPDARVPTDSTLLPFVALLAAAVVAGVLRRKM